MRNNGNLLTVMMIVLVNIVFVSKSSSNIQLKGSLKIEKMLHEMQLNKECIVQKVFKRRLQGKDINIDRVIVNLRNFSEVIARKVLVLHTLVHDEAITLISDIKSYNKNMHKLYRSRKLHRSKVKVALKEMNANGEPRYLNLLRYMFPVEINSSYSEALAQSINLIPHEIRRLVKYLGRSSELRKKLNTITKYPL